MRLFKNARYFPLKYEMEDRHCTLGPRFWITLFNFPAEQVIGRLRNFEIRIGDNSSSIRANQLCGKHTDGVTAGGLATVTCPTTLAGRYLSIQLVERADYLTLCEVLVNGYLQATGKSVVIDKCSWWKRNNALGRIHWKMIGILGNLLQRNINGIYFQFKYL